MIFLIEDIIGAMFLIKVINIRPNKSRGGDDSSHEFISSGVRSSIIYPMANTPFVLGTGAWLLLAQVLGEQ
jgi:hypothetical protein